MPANELAVAANITLNHYLILSGIIFSLGIMTVLLRKNIIVMLMGVELMLNAVNLSVVAFSQFNADIAGNIIVFFVMTIAAAEAGVGLALATTIYKRFKDLDMRKFDQLKG